MYGSTTSTFFYSYLGYCLANSDADVTIGGGGYFNSPLRVTIDYLTTSSFKSISFIRPLGLAIVPTIYYINFVMLLEYRVDD